MSKILTVFGATGNQGGSVAHYVLDDPQLSKEFKVRAITRDTSSPAAQKLASKGAELAALASQDDLEAVKKVMQGTHTVFALTVTTMDQKTYETEFRHGKNIADAAVAVGAKYIIFSSQKNVTKVSEGKYPKVTHFDVKYDVEQYIRGLDIKSAFFIPCNFMQNFHAFFTPRPAGDGTYVMANILKPDVPLACIEIVADTGKYVGAILAEPDKYEGTVWSAGTARYTPEDVVAAMSKSSGKTVVYKQLPDDVWKGFLPPTFAEEFTQMMAYCRDFMYYGPEEEAEMKWAQENARGKLTTLDEYFQNNPLKLE